MTPEERDRWVEQWIDAALQHHAAAEPRPGLEARILAGLPAPRRQPVQALWLRMWTGRPGWAIMAAAVTMIVIAIALSLARHPSAFRTAPAPSKSKAPVSAETQKKTSADDKLTSGAKPIHESPAFASPGRKSRVAAVSVNKPRSSGAQGPRLVQFPAPAPLSPQEQLLLRYLQQTPRSELIAVIQENRVFEERARELAAETQTLTP